MSLQQALGAGNCFRTSLGIATVMKSRRNGAGFSMSIRESPSIISAIHIFGTEQLRPKVLTSGVHDHAIFALPFAISGWPGSMSEGKNTP
jgi:hypothetical protein